MAFAMIERLVTGLGTLALVPCFLCGQLRSSLTMSQMMKFNHRVSQAR